MRQRIPLRVDFSVRQRIPFRVDFSVRQQAPPSYFGSQRSDEPVENASRQRNAHVDCSLNGIPDASRCIVCIRGHQAIIHVFKRLSCKERALPQIQPERQETWNLRDNRADAHTNLCAACSGVFAEGSLSSGANTSLLNSFYKRLSPD